MPILPPQHQDVDAQPSYTLGPAIRRAPPAPDPSIAHRRFEAGDHTPGKLIAGDRYTFADLVLPDAGGIEVRDASANVVSAQHLGVGLVMIKLLSPRATK